MDRLVRVRDLRRGPGGMSFFLDLPDLLPLLEPEARRWSWALHRVPELVADDALDLKLAVLEQQVETDRRGLLVTFEELVRFGRSVRQVIWGEFVAAETPSALPLSTESGDAVGRKAIAGLAAIDSTYWLVGGPEAVIDRVAERFGEVDRVEPSQWNRAED